MLRILFSGPILERSRIQAGLNAGHTIKGSDRIKTTTGKQQQQKKNIAATRREKKNTITSSQKVYGLVP